MKDENNLRTGEKMIVKPTPKEDMKNFVIEYVMNRSKTVTDDELDIKYVAQEAIDVWKYIHKQIDKEFIPNE